MAYLRILALTLACELPVLAAVGLWRRRPIGWLLGVALAANLATHGLFFLTYPEVAVRGAVTLTLFEVGIAALEATAYRLIGGLSWPVALGASVVANALSLWLGLVVP